MLAGETFHGEQVPPALAVRPSPGGQVELDDPIRHVSEVRADPVEGVLVGIEEEAAVAAAGQMNELVDGILGLAVPGSAAEVGEEGVLQVHAHGSLPLGGADLAQRQDVGLEREARQALGGRRDNPS